MEIILLAFSLLLCWKLRAFPVLMIFLVIRVLATPLIHFICHYVIYVDTQGFDMVFNDEIYYYRLAHTSDFEANIWQAISTGGTSIFFGWVLYFVKDYTFDLLFFVRSLNLLCFVLIVLLSLKIARKMNIPHGLLSILLVLLIFSPTLNYFSIKISRDMIITCVLLQIACFLVTSRWVLFVLSGIGMCFLRAHLAASVLFSLPILFLRRGFLVTLLLGFSTLAVMSVLELEYFSSFLSQDSDFVLNYFINLLGLNFIFGDGALMALSRFEVAIRRIFAFDTFVPQLLLLFVLMSGKFKISTLTRFYICLNIPYLYLYQKAEFTAARQTILPFLPLIYIQLVHYFSIARNRLTITSNSETREDSVSLPGSKILSPLIRE